MKQLEIEVDYNNDKLILKENDKVIYELSTWIDPRKYIDFFEELLNRYTPEETTISLTRTDEDTKTIIDEW
jgi:hypothetical protein